MRGEEDEEEDEEREEGREGENEKKRRSFEGLTMDLGSKCS